MESFLIFYILILVAFDLVIHQKQSSGSLFVIINFASLILGFKLYGISTDGASIVLDMETESLRDIYISGLLLIAVFGSVRLLVSINSANREAREQRERATAMIPQGWILPFAIVSILLLIAGSGPSELLWREVYMVETSQVIKSIATVGCLASLYLLGYGASKRENAQKGTYYIMLAVYFLVFLGYSSRMCSLSFALFCLGFRSAVKSRSSALGLLVSIACFPLLLHISLFMRSQPEQGLIPVISKLVQGSAFEGFSLYTTFNNVIGINFVITALTAVTADLDVHYFVTSLNPLPGFMTDWYEIGGSLNASTPYSMMGEWLSVGLPFAVAFFALLGVLYGCIDRLSIRGDLYFSTVGFIVMNLSTITMLQYHTRTSTRLIYYLLGGRLLVKILSYFILPLFRLRSKL